ncbi:MAG: type II toxin-antitoxin system death-on-curing family toxin [Armatimonadota bacterium]
MKLPSQQQIVALHDDIIQETGGAAGLLSSETLARCVGRPLAGCGEVELFPTVFAKAAALAHAIATEHPFVDGNKRTALGCAARVLRLNGSYLPEAPDEVEVMVSLARGELILEEFASWLAASSRPVLPREDERLSC